MKIAENIRKYRELNNMEQKDLAEKLCISNKTVSSWECGRTTPSIGFIETLAKIFNCTKTDLLDDIEESKEALNPDEYYVMRTFRSFNEEGQDMVIKYIKFLESEQIYKKRNSEYKMVQKDS